MNHPQKILLIQLRRIGDVLMCTPAVRALKQHFPDSYVAFLTEKESSDLLTLNPYLDEVIVLEKQRYRNPFYSLKKIWQIREKSFDPVIDFLGNPRSAYFSFFSGAKRRVGYDLPLRRFFYNAIVKNDGMPRYAAVTKLEALRPLGIENFDPKLDFFITEEAKIFAEKFFQENRLGQNNLVISISPTSRRHFNRWDLKRYARLADWLISRFQATVVLVWGPDEREVMEKMKNMMEKEPVISWETKNLFELGAILGKCDLHIGNDNGTKHIAVAMEMPTITIYGPHDPTSWTYPDFSRHKFVKANVDCPECDEIKHKCAGLSCLDQITVEDVQRVFFQLLKDMEKTKEKRIVEKIEHLAAD